jgi:hypothetical protein
MRGLPFLADDLEIEKLAWKMTRKPLRIFLFNLIACLAVLLLFEGILRAFLRSEPDIDFLRFMIPSLRHEIIEDPHKVLISVQDKLQRLVDHERLGWFHPSDAKIRGKFQTTREGFHTPDNPAPHEPQLIVIGDSFLEGIRETRPLAWELKRLTGEKILNLSAGGWGPGSYLAAYELFGSYRNAKAVIVFSFVNDAVDARNFRMWEQMGKTTSYKQFFFNRRWYGYSVNSGHTWLDRKSAAYNLGKYGLWKWGIINLVDDAEDALLDRFSYADLEHTKSAACWNHHCIEVLLKLNKNRLFLVCDAWDWEPEGVCYEYFDDYFGYIGELNNAAIRAGHRLLLAWIPSRERVYFDMLPESTKATLLRGRTEIVGAEAAVGSFARRNGIEFFDLTGPLIAAAKEHIARGKELYGAGGNPQDGHFNDFGTVIAAEAVHRVLVERKLLRDK